MRLSIMLGIWLSVVPAALAQPPTDWATGSALKRQLAEPAGFAVTGIPLRMALADLAHSQRVSILLDRRVDPDQPLTLTVDDMPLSEILQSLAKQQGLGVAVLGSVVYLGPVSFTARLQTLAQLRHDEARAHPEIARQLLATTTFCWPDFAEPRDLLTQLANQSRVTIEGLDRIPHDLWAAGQLPSMTWADCLTLIAGQFDLTFAIAVDGHAVKLVPIPADVPSESHPLSSAKSTNKQTSRPSEKRYTLRQAKGQLDLMLPQLGERLGIEFHIDREALERTGISLRQQVNISVNNATLDELLTAILKPAGCTFRRQGKVVEVLPEK